MRRKALGKHRWSILPGLLLCITAAGPIYAAPERTSTQIAIGNPLPNSLVAGRISLSVAYDQGVGRITALTVFVDDKILYSRSVLGTNLRGLHYLDLDTRTMADGNHAVKVVAMGLRGPVAIDEVAITVRNGVAGGADLVAPLVQLKGYQDGDTISGKLSLDILAEDNSGTDLLVSVFVNRLPRLIKSRPPYTLDLNTAPYLDPVTQRGTIMIEAWAYDRANNLGKSRQVTLNVVAPGKENETKKQDDPTRPAISGPMLPDANIKGSPAPMQGEFVIPVPVGPVATQPSAPPAADATANGRPVIKPEVREPGDRPATAPTVKPSGRVSPPQPQKGVTGSAGIAGSKTSAPTTARPAGKAADAKGGLSAPAPIATNSGAAALSGSRGSAPIVTIKPKPVVVAQAKPFNPEIVPAKPAPAKPVEVATAKIEISMPEIIDRPGTLAEASIGSSTPMPSPGGTRSSMPTADRPKAEKPGIIIAVVDKKSPGKNGKSSVELYTINDMPSDRGHRVAASDTMHSIARKYGVTVKSLQVANGINDGRAMRAGSILKVPGTFDIVLNNQRVAFDVPPRIDNGLAITPFRQIMEYAGGVVVWDGEKREISAANEQSSIKLTIGSKEALVNQTVIVMDREAFLDSGRTMVPVSFMEKALDLKAEYDVKSGTIMLVRR